MKPSEFLGLKFAFEDTSNDTWPNVIILEFALHCSEGWQCPQDLDNLIHSLKSKWQKQGLQPPAFILLELFYAHGMLRCNGLQGYTIDQDGFNRGSPSSGFILSLARFYRHAFVSATDALWPALIRHRVRYCNSLSAANTSSSNASATEAADQVSQVAPRWPYHTDDGMCLSAQGHDFVARQLLGPFLLSHAQVRL